MAFSSDHVWPEVLEALREELPDRTVKNWFESAVPEIEDSSPPTLLLNVPTAYHRDHIRDRYYSVLQTALRETLEKDVEIQFSVDGPTDSTARDGDSQTASTSPRPPKEGERPPARTEGKKKTVPPSRGDRSSAPQNATAESRSHQGPAPSAEYDSSSPSGPSGFHWSKTTTTLKGRYTFESFVEGDSNALAKNASTAVAENPGSTNFNPLLIYGGVGLGKTHLAQAIANYSADHQTAEYICYASSEKFTSEFVRAIRSGDGDQFSEKYRKVDLLILDDIQFFQGKEKTQEEFFHLFNALYQQNKQIVLCADRPPQEIDDVERRLLSRFEWGLSADIQRPTLETRLAILQLKARALDLKIEKEVLDLMAESITGNIRQLEGALKQLSAKADLMDEKIDVATARRLLSDQIQLPSSTSVTAEDILEGVANHYGVSHEDLVGRSRREELTEARHVAMYFCRQLTSLSFSDIGLRFGGRDHSTVSHACGKIEDRLDVQPELNAELDEVKRTIHGYSDRV